jgi:hypothetical protein
MATMNVAGSRGRDYAAVNLGLVCMRGKGRIARKNQSHLERL